MNKLTLDFSELTGPICVMGLSGIGKTHLAKLYPGLIYDTDRALDKATELYWPDLSAYNRRREWRKFCSTSPWNNDQENLEKWSAIRKEYNSLLLKYFNKSEDCIILTSEFSFPRRVDLYVGIVLGQYEMHLNKVGKIQDNGQCEAMNYRLEGYTPLIRIQPGNHLSDSAPIRAWIDKRTDFK